MKQNCIFKAKYEIHTGGVYTLPHSMEQQQKKTIIGRDKGSNHVLKICYYFLMMMHPWRHLDVESVFLIVDFFSSFLQMSMFDWRPMKNLNGV